MCRWQIKIAHLTKGDNETKEEKIVWRADGTKRMGSFDTKRRGWRFIPNPRYAGLGVVEMVHFPVAELRHRWTAEL